MKKILALVIFAALALMPAGCNKYDDSDLQRRVSALETSMNQLLGYKDLLAKLDAGKTVTAFSQSGNEITLTFSDGKTITFNQKGPKGDPGDSIKGDPGDPGDPGSPGQDGITPQVKIEGENWMVSYDEGKTWKNIGSAIDRSLISAIAVNEAGDTLTLTLADGTAIPIFYGDSPAAEPFGFEIAGGRRGFSVLENKDWAWFNTIDLEYTLTGDIKDEDDVQFEFRVTPDVGGGYLVPIYQRYAYDAKSGVFYITQNVGNNDVEPHCLMMRCSELLVEVTAHFPDRTSVYKKIYITEFGWDIYPKERSNYSFDWNSSNTYGRLELPASAGTLVLQIYVYSCSSDDFDEYYDGQPLNLQTIPTENIFYVRHNYGDFKSTFSVTGPVDTFGWGNDAFAVYEITISYPENTTGKEQTETVTIEGRQGAPFTNIELGRAAH